MFFVNCQCLHRTVSQSPHWDNQSLRLPSLQEAEILSRKVPDLPPSWRSHPPTDTSPNVPGIAGWERRGRLGEVPGSQGPASLQRPDYRAGECCWPGRISWISGSWFPSACWFICWLNQPHFEWLQCTRCRTRLLAYNNDQNRHSACKCRERLEVLPSPFSH